MGLLKRKGLVGALNDENRLVLELIRIDARDNGGASGEPAPLTLECDDVGTLSRVVQSTRLVPGRIHASVAFEVEQGLLIPLTLKGAPALFTEMGIVMLRGAPSRPWRS